MLGLLGILLLVGCKSPPPKEGGFSADYNDTIARNRLKKVPIAYPETTQYETNAVLRAIYLEGFKTAWDDVIELGWGGVRTVPERYLNPRSFRDAWSEGHQAGFHAVMSRLGALADPTPVRIAQEQEARRHAWESVEYPDLPRRTIDKFHRSVMLVNSTNTLTHQNTLRLHIIYSARYPRDGSQSARTLPSGASNVTVRLHSPDGGIVDCKADTDANGIGIQMSGIASYDYSYTLPWQTNALDEAWIELHSGDEGYWAEIPYGFTRNPSSPLPATGNRRGTPALAPAMEKMGANDQILPWESVHYDVGSIQNGWRLDFKISNPFDARAEVILYRDDGRVSKSMYLWDLHSPRTTFEIDCPSRTICSTEMSIVLHDDGLRRSEFFNVCREPNDERCWGTALITVDKKAYSVVLPSSLFQYQHGKAKTGQKLVVPLISAPR
jgi:hypothetical protein